MSNRNMRDSFYLPLVEDSLDLVLQSLLGLGVSKLVLSNDLLEFLSGIGELTMDEESSWEEVIVVDYFDEWFDLGSSLNFIFAHVLCDFTRGSLDTSNQGVWETLALLSIIKLLNNDCFLSSSSSGEHNAYSACFHSIKKDS